MNTPLGRLRNGSDPAAARAWIEELLTALGATDRAGKWQCPAHGAIGEHSVALSIGTGDRGVLVHCHGGCSLAEVLGALGLQRRHLFRPPPVPPALHVKARLGALSFPPPREPGGSSGTGWTPPEVRGFVPTAIHPYATLVDPGTEVAWKVRYRNPDDPKDKEPAWFALDPETGERRRNLCGRKEVDLALYHQSDLPAALAAGRPILVVESESSVDALRAAGFTATTWAGGARSRSLDTVGRVLGEHGGITVVIPDNDEAGLAAALRLKAMLPGTVILDVRAFIPDATGGTDARDLLDALGADALRRAVDEARGTDVPEMSGAPSERPATVVQVPTFSWLYGPPVRVERMVWRRWIGWTTDVPPTPCTPITEPRDVGPLEPEPGSPTLAEALADSEAARWFGIARCRACRPLRADDLSAVCEVHERGLWEAFGERLRRSHA